MTGADQLSCSRRRVFEAVGAGALAVAVAGCSFSYSSDDPENHIRNEETFDIEAEAGEEIRVAIRGTDHHQDDSGVDIDESGFAELFDPTGQVVAELSFRGDGHSDEATVGASTAGTYEFTVRPNTDTLAVTIEVGDETVLG